MNKTLKDLWKYDTRKNKKQKTKNKTKFWRLKCKIVTENTTQTKTKGSFGD